MFLYFATIVFPALLMAAFYARIYMVVVGQVSSFFFLLPLPHNDMFTAHCARGQMDWKAAKRNGCAMYVR